MNKYFILLLFSAIYSQSPFNSNLPYQAYDYSIVQKDSIVYFVGGQMYSSGQEIDSVFSYNLNTHEWTNLANMEQPRSNIGLVRKNNMIYALKGRDGGNWIEVYDISSNIWTTYNNDSGDLIGNGETSYNNFYTICDGVIYATQYWAQNLWGSINGLIWTNIGGWNNQFGEPTLVASDDKVYIISGDSNNGAFIEFDPVSDTFQELAPFSIVERGYKNNAIYNNGKIYKFNNGDSDDRIEVYDIATNTWEAHYFPVQYYGQELEYIEIDPVNSKYFVFDNNYDMSGFYFYADENPHILTISDYEMFEDDTLEIILPVFTLGDDPYFFAALSNVEDVQVTLNSDTLLIIPNPNWTGDCEISGIVNTANGYSDTTTFTLSVLQTDPRILTIEDVPEDQGGRVYINFSKSYFDSVGGYNNTAYGSYQVERLDDIGWVGVGSYDAYGIEDYIIEVNTLSDSMYTSEGMTTFRVIANMNQGNFISMPDSGYSVDNIAPGVPTGFMVAMGDNGLDLSWNEVQDEDFQYYVIDKSADSLFMTDQYGSFSTINTFYNDADYEYGTVYYRVSAIDYAGNRGDFSGTVSTSILGLDDDVIPQVFTLHQNYPNPFNPITSLRYDLPEDGLVNIAIYDMMGRVVKTLLNSSQTAGYKSIQWNATNNRSEPVSAGVYLYSIETKDFRQTKKMILLK